MEEKMLTFEEKLDKLLETAKKKKNVLEEQEILDVFAKEELTPEKLDQIYDFLDNKKVDVLKISSDETWIRTCLQKKRPEKKIWKIWIFRCLRAWGSRIRCVCT